MTLSNHNQNEHQSANFEFNVNFPISQPLAIEKFVMHP